MPEALKILFSPPMNIRTHIQALLICTMPLSAQGQSIVDSRASLPRAVQLHGDEGRETVRPDESKRISPNEAPASRVQPQRIVNRIAATVNGRPITANEVSVRLMPIGAQLAAQYPKQGPEFYKQLALAKKNIIEDLVERELLRNEFEGMGGVIRDSLIDQEVNRTILTTCPEVLHYTGIWTDTLRGGATQLVNTNKLLKRYNGITGLKTGTTSGAGVCISASATRDGLDLIAVVLGSLSSSERFTAATTLLDYGFAAYAAVPLPAMEDRPLLIKVKGSAEESVPLDYTALPETLLMPKESAAALTAQLDLPQELEAPVQLGQNVGTVRILSGETQLGEYEVRAAADADNASHFSGRFYFGFYFIHHIHNFFRTAAQKHACFRQRKIAPAHKKFRAEFLFQLLHLPA